MVWLDSNNVVNAIMCILYRSAVLSQKQRYHTPTWNYIGREKNALTGFKKIYESICMHLHMRCVDIHIHTKQMACFRHGKCCLILMSHTWIILLMMQTSYCVVHCDWLVILKSPWRL